jgi:hypothetical protein
MSCHRYPALSNPHYVSTVSNVFGLISPPNSGRKQCTAEISADLRRSQRSKSHHWEGQRHAARFWKIVSSCACGACSHLSEGDPINQCLASFTMGVEWVGIRLLLGSVRVRIVQFFTQLRGENLGFGVESKCLPHWSYVHLLSYVGGTTLVIIS